jgi:hypothetical protein
MMDVSPNGFSLVPLLVAVAGIVMVGLVFLPLILYIRQWTQNNNSTILTVDAKVMVKRAILLRTQVHYYVTFEIADGKQKEFNVSGKEYDMLTEGDVGRVSFQGTRYKGFERITKGETK